MIAEVVEEAAEFHTGGDAEGEEVVAGEQGRAQGGLPGEVGGLGLHEFVMLQGAVRAEAVKAVEGEFQRKGVAQDHAAAGGLAHLYDILELHVVEDAGDDFIDFFTGETEALQNYARHFGTDFFMAIEVDAAG